MQTDKSTDHTSFTMNNNSVSCIDTPDDTVSVKTKLAVKSTKELQIYQCYLNRTQSFSLSNAFSIVSQNDTNGVSMAIAPRLE